jgi:ketosteroid isomerase-like protein
MLVGKAKGRYQEDVMGRGRTTVFVGVGIAAVAVCWLLAQHSLLGKPPDIHDADRAAIDGVLKAQQAAWNRGDVDAFLVGYWQSPELTFSGSNGVSRGWDGVLARYKKNYPNRDAMGELNFSDLEFHFLGSDAALVLGKWHLKREMGDIGGVFSLVWQKFPEGWKIIHDHTSVVGFPQPNP